jgi:integrase
VVDLLRRRERVARSLYVFPGECEYGHLVDARKQMDKVTARSGVSFCLHDLRRTFITTAESLDIGVYAIKHLVNHKMSSDVTAGYVVMDINRLRAAMQKITNHMLSLIESKRSPKIILLDRHRQSIPASDC